MSATLWLSDPDVTLYHGDVLAVLRELPAESVDCCVTSPPYWGLRDYGTGQWEGGDEGCDHRKMESRQPHERKSSTLDGGTDTIRVQEEANVYRDTCRKCGATRIDQQLGLEPTPEEYVTRMVEVFREVRRVLAPHGTVWLNLGDSYASQPAGNVTPSGFSQTRPSRRKHGKGDETVDIPPRSFGDGLKQKDLVGVPWRVAFALQADGWYLRSDIIWAKPNPMPESVTDRPTKAHEMVFLLTKSPRYYYDAEAIRERFTVAGVVQGADLTSEVGVFRNDLRFEEASPITEIGVRLATAILDRPHAQEDLGLLALDPQVGQEGRDDVAGNSVTRVPVERRATAQAARFAHGDVSAKEFLSEMHGLWVALPDGDQLKEAWRFAFAHVRLVDTDGDGTVRVHHTSEVGEFKLLHDEQYTGGPTPSRGPDGRKVTHVEAGNGSIQHRSGERWPTPAGRNARSVWTIATQPYPEAHFATFPEELARRCIAAGTSERGKCPECGAPWVREVERETMEINRSERTHSRGQTRSSGTMTRPPSSKTLGWVPSCAHSCVNGSNFRTQNPAVVLDPFIGSGTVAYVARKLGRHAVGIDLNESYLELAARRLQQQSLFASEALS